MRVAPIQPGTRPELAEEEARILGARGQISPLYQVLLNSPAIARGWEQMLSAVRRRSSVPARLRELAILRVAVLNSADYEFEAHAPLARDAGVSQAAIEATRSLPLDLRPFDGTEQLVLRLTDAMTREIVVPDDLYAEIRDAFDAQAQVELVATVAAYNMVSRFLVAMQLAH